MKLLNIKKTLAASLAGISLMTSAIAWSSVAVIVHPSNSDSMSASQITRIFLGKKKSFPGGGKAIPLDQKEGSPARTAFVGTILKKSNQQNKAYWAQLLFTGKGTPPKEVDGAAAVKSLVSENPALIGYIDSTEVDESVKVVHQF